MSAVRSMLRTALAGPIIGLAVFAASPAGAVATVTQTPYYPTYYVTSPYNINSMIITGHGNENDGSYIISSQPGGFQTSPGTSVIQDPFPETYFPLFSSLFGVSDLIPGALPGDPGDGSLHLILAVNNGFAASLLGQEFTNIFSGFTEAGLIEALQTVSSGDATKAQRDAAGSTLFSFSDAVYTQGGNFNVTLNEGFSLVGFSQGQGVGSGQSLAVPVPEPATWAMLIGGTGVIGLALRRRRSTAAAPRLA